MSATQLQIRRGTTAQNNSFIGAMGEITFDTTTKSLRLHDGVTVGGRAIPTYSGVVPEGGDYVVVSYYAADGSSWYRQYQSGWVEQGGTVTTSTGDYSITLPITMANNTYCPNLTPYQATSTTDLTIRMLPSSTTTTLIIKTTGNGASVGFGVKWEVKGLAAA